MNRLELKSIPNNEAELHQLFKSFSEKSQKRCVVLPMASVKSMRKTGTVAVENGIVSTPDLAHAIDAAFGVVDQQGIERVLYRIAEIQLDGQAISGVPIAQPAGILEVKVDVFYCQASLLAQLRNAAAMAKITIACFDVELPVSKPQDEEAMWLNIPINEMATLQVFRNKVVISGRDP